MNLLSKFQFVYLILKVPRFCSFSSETDLGKNCTSSISESSSGLCYAIPIWMNIFCSRPLLPKITFNTYYFLTSLLSVSSIRIHYGIFFPPNFFEHSVLNKHSNWSMYITLYIFFVNKNNLKFIFLLDNYEYTYVNVKCQYLLMYVHNDQLV